MIMTVCAQVLIEDAILGCDKSCMVLSARSKQHKVQLTQQSLRVFLTWIIQYMVFGELSRVQAMRTLLLVFVSEGDS